MTHNVRTRRRQKQSRKKSNPSQTSPESYADVGRTIQLLRTNPEHMNQRQIVQLQRTIGNQQVASLLHQNNLQREDDVDLAFRSGNWNGCSAASRSSAV